MKYEYKTMMLEIPMKKGFFGRSPDAENLDLFNSKLQDLGDQGWQLVGVVPTTDGGSPAQITHAVHYFMRTKSPPAYPS